MSRSRSDPGALLQTAAQLLGSGSGFKERPDAGGVDEPDGGEGSVRTLRMPEVVNETARPGVR